VDCEIDGVVIRDLIAHRDARGRLMELFRQDELSQADHPVMAYVAVSEPGATRGPHEHRTQSDCFAFTGPSTFRIRLWDNRPDSVTYGRTFSTEAGENRPLLVLIPPGVVHAYTNIGSVPGVVYNAPNRLYAGEGKSCPVDEIRYEEDPNSPFKLRDDA
jgi:dTDP-4-dehydrorhamnose 3,5-epimerase